MKTKQVTTCSGRVSPAGYIEARQKLNHLQGAPHFSHIMILSRGSLGRTAPEERAFASCLKGASLRPHSLPSTCFLMVPPPLFSMDCREAWFSTKLTGKFLLSGHVAMGCAARRQVFHSLAQVSPLPMTFRTCAESLKKVKLSRLLSAM